MRLLVVPDYRTLSSTAADVVTNAVRRKPGLCFGLPTGNTPLGMYSELVARFRNEPTGLSQVTTFNLDEYLGLPAGHPQSFAAYMRHHFFDHVHIPAGNIHIPRSDAIDPLRESEAYEETIRETGGIDLLIVGIGANGHIAFNEPGSSLESRTRPVDLAPETIETLRPQFGNEVPRRAITMGIGTILEARRILLLASGTVKAAIVERALRGPVSASIPASALQLHPDVIAILDEAAARS